MHNVRESVTALITDTVLEQRPAKYMVEQCFRNSELEDLHAGTTPSSNTGDYSDVVVRTPFAEIPWRELSRFEDREMKALMIDVVNRTYRFINRLFSAGDRWRSTNSLSGSGPAPAMAKSDVADRGFIVAITRPGVTAGPPLVQFRIWIFGCASSPWRLFGYCGFLGHPLS